MIDEYKEKEETDEVKMPDEKVYGFPTEATPINPSQLEIEATEEVLKPSKSPAQEDTRLLTKEEEKENDKRDEAYRKRENPKPETYESKRDIGFAKALEEELNGEPSKEYRGQHVYVWWKKDTNGDWNLNHTMPKNLKDRLQRGGATIEDEDVIYGGKKFKKYSEFEYVYSCITKPKKDCRPGDNMRINKYSLTPNAEDETKNRMKCGDYSSNDLTQRTPSRFPNNKKVNNF